MPTIERYQKSYEDFIAEAQLMQEKGYYVNPALYAKAKLQEQQQTPVKEREEEVSYPLNSK